MRRSAALHAAHALAAQNLLKPRCARQESHNCGAAAAMAEVSVETVAAVVVSMVVVVVVAAADRRC